MVGFALALLVKGPGITRGRATTQWFAAFTGALMTSSFVRGVGCGMGSALRRKRVHWRPIYPHSLARVNDFFKHHQQFLFKTPQPLVWYRQLAALHLVAPAYLPAQPRVRPHSSF